MDRGLRLPKLISDGMVLQRDDAVTIWGWAASGASVRVGFLGDSYQATADSQGRWALPMQGLKPGGPFLLTVESEGETIRIRDVYVGDVWLASGQSNMELPISRVYDTYREELCHAENPYIRQFKVVEDYDFHGPKEDVAKGDWKAVNPKDVMDFSAAGYFFAKELNERYSVPIGIVNATKGGSPIESWLSEEALAAFPQHVKTLSQFRDDAYLESVVKENEANMEGWYRKVYSEDVGMADAWSAFEWDDSDWDKMCLPADFEDYGLEGFNGVVWFRKEFTLPASMVGEEAKLWLGTIRDADDVYINGVKVGDTGYQYPPRKYTVPSDLLREGVNRIAIRVLCDNGKGRFTKEKLYRLFLDKDPSKPLKVLTKLSPQSANDDGEWDDELGIDLSGEWKYKVSLTTDPKPSFTFVEWKPCGLYNAMLAPLHVFKVRGVIWYQGESNVGRAHEYEKTFSLLIKECRKNWDKEDLPFLYVQLANYEDSANPAAESGWAKLRDTQTGILNLLPNTAMAVAHDIGEWNDLHPQNKKDLGHRLALAARKLAYGEELTHSGPILKEVKRKGSELWLSFDHVGGGLVARDADAVGELEIMGEKGTFAKADSRIEGDALVVWKEGIGNPVKVRYAWSDAPEGANLYNKEGLPASCFLAECEASVI